MDLNEFRWTRQPKSFEIKDGTISVTTLPHTDLWQRTYYHFQNDSVYMHVHRKTHHLRLYLVICRQRNVPGRRMTDSSRINEEVGLMAKKIVVVNAGPRAGFNTDTLLKEAAKGCVGSSYFECN